MAALHSIEIASVSVSVVMEEGDSKHAHVILTRVVSAVPSRALSAHESSMTSQKIDEILKFLDSLDKKRNLQSTPEAIRNAPSKVPCAPAQPKDYVIEVENRRSE